MRVILSRKCSSTAWRRGAYVERADAEYVWVLDPIDGTRAFITGLPIWGTLIALLHRGVPVLGVIDRADPEGVAGSASAASARR